jgi:hypothetical protein
VVYQENKIRKLMRTFKLAIGSERIILVKKNNIMFMITRVDLPEKLKFSPIINLFRAKIRPLNEIQNTMAYKSE